MSNKSKNATFEEHIICEDTRNLESIDEAKLVMSAMLKIKTSDIDFIEKIGTMSIFKVNNKEAWDKIS